LVFIDAAILMTHIFSQESHGQQSHSAKYFHKYVVLQTAGRTPLAYTINLLCLRITAVSCPLSTIYHRSSSSCWDTPAVTCALALELEQDIAFASFKFDHVSYWFRRSRASSSRRSISKCIPKPEWTFFIKWFELWLSNFDGYGWSHQHHIMMWRALCWWMMRHLAITAVEENLLHLNTFNSILRTMYKQLTISLSHTTHNSHSKHHQTETNNPNCIASCPSMVPTAAACLVLSLVRARCPTSTWWVWITRLRLIATSTSSS